MRPVRTGSRTGPHRFGGSGCLNTEPFEPRESSEVPMGVLPRGGEGGARMRIMDSLAEVSASPRARPGARATWGRQNATRPGRACHWLARGRASKRALVKHDRT
jgi:hypothetical protein